MGGRAVAALAMAGVLRALGGRPGAGRTDRPPPRAGSGRRGQAGHRRVPRGLPGDKRWHLRSGSRCRPLARRAGGERAVCVCARQSRREPPRRHRCGRLPQASRGKRDDGHEAARAEVVSGGAGNAAISSPHMPGPQGRRRSGRRRRLGRNAAQRAPASGRPARILVHRAQRGEKGARSRRLRELHHGDQQTGIAASAPAREGGHLPPTARPGAADDHARACPRGWLSLAAGYSLPAPSLMIEGAPALAGARWSVVNSGDAPTRVVLQLTCGRVVL